MLGLDTIPHFVLAVIVSAINAVFLCLVATKLIHVLQLSGYRLRPYITWAIDIRQKFIIRILALALLGFGSTFILQLFLADGAYVPREWRYLGLIFYFALGTILVTWLFRTPVKVPLRLTPRVWRLFTVFFLLSTVLTYLLAWWAFAVGGVWGGAGLASVSLLVYASPIILLFAYFILEPLELLIKQFYLWKAKRKLFSPQYKDLIRIGITGSYGKTSCKNILAAMLSKKYNVLMSPASFNTPMGFARTVNNELKPEHQVLIMEMGMRYKGDIKTMAKLFKPQHGMLTSIGSAHLETMKTLEAIRNEKYELINALPEGGFKVTNDASESERKTGNVGKIETNLLGEHNKRNIALCTEMALKFGITQKQIAETIKELKPVPHRLEVTKTEHGITIIDDSYNSCPEGCLAALELLGSLKGKGQAIILTPGMVELGKRADEENFKFGVRMSAVADKVIIVNEINKQQISDGLLAGGFLEANIFFAKNLEAAKEIYAPMLKSGDTLLIENDLPDNYV